MEITDKQITQAFHESAKDILAHFKTPYNLIRYISTAAEGVHLMEIKFNKKASTESDLYGANYFLMST